VARLEGPLARPQLKGARWGMGGARTAGGGSRDRTRHYPLVKNPHKMEEAYLFFIILEIKNAIMHPGLTSIDHYATKFYLWMIAAIFGLACF